MTAMCRYIALLFLLTVVASFAEWQADEIPEGVYCDADSDCFLLPDAPLEKPVPALIYLSCTGGKPWDIDSVRVIFDELGWAIATCGKSRNHRAGNLNEEDILRLQAKLERTGQVDKNHIYMFGFSGQGAQALGTALRHPNIFAGTITDCAHTGSITYFDPKASAKQAFYIISKTRDWNLEHNESLHKILREYGIRDTLIIEEGEHGIGPASEVFRGCLWLNGEIK